MNKFKTYTLTFDTKVKIIITLCVLLAIIIISYSFYIICLNNEDKEAKIKLDALEDILSIKEYEAKYKLIIKSNKNENEYEIYENANLEEDKYEYILNDEVKIQVDKNISTLINQKINKSFEYNTENKYNNIISFSSIIKYLNQNSDTKVTKVECNNNTEYRIDVTDLFVSITRIDIVVDSTCKINEIKMYNKDLNVVYQLLYESFKVKK